MAHAVVIVLGDLGRSPRMQYHAKSLAQLPSFGLITQIGYVGEEVMVRPNPQHKAAVMVEKRIAPWEAPILRRIALLHALLKGLGLLIQLFVCMASLQRYDVVIIQNPPCLPALVAAVIMSLWNGSIIVIDWHNLGYAMFEERYGSRHILVRIAKILERLMTKRAHLHICVSQAMQSWLREHFHVNATVLYDRPSQLFKSSNNHNNHNHNNNDTIATDNKGNERDDTMQRPSMQQRHDLLSRLGFTDEKLFPFLKDTSDDSMDTASASSSSTKLLVSATSWTADEDFSILLDALQELERCLSQTTTTTNTSETTITAKVPITMTTAGSAVQLLVVVTGKGPMKAAFEARVKELADTGLLNHHIAVRTAWLSANDYALLLRCADLGISLHTSTSGLDLPMKVVDMFGSGLPVCAIAFPTLPELVRHGENGYIFHTSLELKDRLFDLLIAEGHECMLNNLRKVLVDDNIGTWDENWTTVMEPIILSCLRKGKIRGRNSNQEIMVIAAIVVTSVVVMVLMDKIFVPFILRPILQFGL